MIIHAILHVEENHFSDHVLTFEEYDKKQYIQLTVDMYVHVCPGKYVSVYECVFCSLYYVSLCNGERDEHNTILHFIQIYFRSPAGYSPTGSEQQALST